jgi:hypothetical protein
MRSVAALAAAALALAGVLAVSGCGPRAGRLGGGSNGQQGPAPTQTAPANQGGGAVVDTSALDGELRSIDALLSDADTELANADKTPEDAD